MKNQLKEKRKNNRKYLILVEDIEQNLYYTLPIYGTSKYNSRNEVKKYNPIHFFNIADLKNLHESKLKDITYTYDDALYHIKELKKQIADGIKFGNENSNLFAFEEFYLKKLKIFLRKATPKNLKELRSK